MGHEQSEGHSPLHRAVHANMHHCICLEVVLDPFIEGLQTLTMLTVRPALRCRALTAMRQPQPAAMHARTFVS